MTDTPRKALGSSAEQHACDYLCARGFQLITKNYRCFRGEIDLIMRDKKDVVFVEVRSRSYTNYGNAAESITKTKQKKIITTAIHFLQQKNWLNKINCRFDVIGIQKNEVDWIKDAFTADIF
jgi:putative endonuclease